MSYVDDIPDPQTRLLTLPQKLEQQGRRIVEQVSNNESGAMVGEIIIAQKIALALDQIERVRQLDQLHRKELLQLECKIGTEIKRLMPEYGQWRDEHLQDRENLESKLLRIDRDRRKQTLDHESLLRAMHGNLLDLLQKHAQLAPGIPPRLPAPGSETRPPEVKYVPGSNLRNSEKLNKLE